ncbi:MAG: methionine/alanine import family NSS transporter small subunit [Aeromicrobium sp.]|nr:methionine/alanine import family NSS transporter small subunit [Aeromicrobium sp.]MCK5890507.1 methionine/alanine import family NSS transporter small subunit [Aeromicrobium sp.]MDF1703519.1 methionine/alanine import family NSS transporter small subunit [Aeromicrobium sp.]
MSTGAIIMMVLAMLIIWGGLAAAIISLSRRPDASADSDAYETGGTHRDL